MNSTKTYIKINQCDTELTEKSAWWKDITNSDHENRQQWLFGVTMAFAPLLLLIDTVFCQTAMELQSNHHKMSIKEMPTELDVGRRIHTVGYSRVTVGHCWRFSWSLLVILALRLVTVGEFRVTVGHCTVGHCWWISRSLLVNFALRLVTVGHSRVTVDEG